MDDIDIITFLSWCGLVNVSVFVYGILQTIWVNIEIAELGIAYTTKIDTIICFVLTLFIVNPLWKVLNRRVKGELK